MKFSKLIYLLLFLFLFINVDLHSQNLESNYLYTITLDLDKPVDAGKSPYGTRVGYPIRGGTFEGPNLKGIVKPIGEDWLLKVDEKTNKLDVRLMLETEDGQLIACTYKGIVHINNDGSTYWRISPFFETSSEKYNWLNYIVSVGKGSFQNGKVTYEVFEIK